MLLAILLVSVVPVTVAIGLYRARHRGSGKKWDGVDWFLLLALQWPYFFLRKWIRGIKD